MTKSDVMTFTLVPQTDRRQQQDRRKSWRGSRRAADLLLQEQSRADAEREAKWNTVSSDEGPGIPGTPGTPGTYDTQTAQPARKLYVH